MSPMALIKDKEGKYTLTVKVIGLLFTAGSLIFASGKFVSTTNQHGVEIFRLDNKVSALDGKVRDIEKGQVRHEVLDSILVNELRDMRSDVKQLLRRR